jgi:hypothetical protein
VGQKKGYRDGQAFMAPEGDIRAQFVMDNLIYRREIPVMIGVFINPGRRPDQPEPTPANWGDRRVHGRLAAARPVQQSLEQRRELYQYSRRK